MPPIDRGWWNLPPGPERERLKRLAFLPKPPPSFVRGPKRHRKTETAWLGHTRVEFTSDKASERLARFASMQHQPIDGIKPMMIGRELWLEAGGQRFFVLPNPTPTQISDVIFKCHLAIHEAETRPAKPATNGEKSDND